MRIFSAGKQKLDGEEDEGTRFLKKAVPSLLPGNES